MKRLIITVAALLLAWAGFAWANDCCGLGPCGGTGPGMQMRQPGMHAPGAGRMQGGPGMQGMQGMRGMRGGRAMGMRDGGGLHRILAMAEELKLTDQQRERIRQMSVDFATERIDRQAELKKAQLRLAELMRNDDANEADVNRGIDEVARLRAEMQKMQYAHRRAMMSVLTDQQRDQMEKMRTERRGRMRDMMDEDEDDDSDDSEQTIPPYRPRRGRI